MTVFLFHVLKLILRKPRPDPDLCSDFVHWIKSVEEKKATTDDSVSYDTNSPKEKKNSKKILYFL